MRGVIIDLIGILFGLGSVELIEMYSEYLENHISILQFGVSEATDIMNSIVVFKNYMTVFEIVIVSVFFVDLIRKVKIK